jgi:hypothetical protein
MAGYEQKWKEYKRLRNALVVIFLGCVPVFALVGTLSVRLFHTAVPASVVAVLLFALFVLLGIRLQLWRCPRCESGFLELGGTTKVFLPDDACIAAFQNTKNSEPLRRLALKLIDPQRAKGFRVLIA